MSLQLWPDNSEYWMEHSHCVLYDPVIISVDTWGNMMVGISYMIIPILLGVAILKQWTALVHYRWLLFHGAVFVLLCGGTHFMNAWNWKHTNYSEQALLQIITGIVSVGFVVHIHRWLRLRKWEK